MTNNHINYYDLGYRLIRKYWGDGFATESALASLTYGFETLKLNEIFAAAHIENIASNRILNKIGLKQEGTFTYDKELHNWYRLESSAWKNAKL
jgi:ribosomal-protein-alanine N-acetyltransferase